MAYATQQDIVDRHGEDVLYVLADRDNDDVLDTALIDQALADATAEIDVYLAAKYDLPLVTVPAVVLRLCVDISVYLMANTGTGRAEEYRQRYEDALALLRRIASGEVSLGLETPPVSAVGGVSVSGPSRTFSRDSMKGL